MDSLKQPICEHLQCLPKTQNMVKVLLLKVVTVINHNTKGVLQTLNSCLRFETKAFHQQGQSVNSCSGVGSHRASVGALALKRYTDDAKKWMRIFFFLFCFCTTYSFVLLELIWRCCIEEGEVSKKHGVENMSFSGLSVCRCGEGESLDRLAGIPTWSAQPVCWVGVCVCARVRGGGRGRLSGQRVQQILEEVIWIRDVREETWRRDRKSFFIPTEKQHFIVTSLWTFWTNFSQQSGSYCFYGNFIDCMHWILCNDGKENQFL